MSSALALRSGLPRRPALATIQVVETTTDGDLIARVGEGDAGAFEQLYRRYSRPVFALALRRLGDRGRAEDAVQETFASIWRSAKSYRSDRGPGAASRATLIDTSHQATFCDSSDLFRLLTPATVTPAAGDISAPWKTSRLGIATWTTVV